jgi:hypothetical protein
MENKGLLFIPDISGFTKFVSQTEIEHSRLIIEELLEILINANQIGLEVSEIEGDAILFYKFGPRPQLEEVYQQVKNMFCSFHKGVSSYALRRYCYCKACNAATDLTLKVITHYGEFTGYNVKQFNKLIGKDIIIAHQLLKNDIDQHEYWLVTKSLLQDSPPADLANWMSWSTSVKQSEAGIIPFHYTLLSELKNEIVPDALPDPSLAKKSKMLSFSKVYETDIITLFHAAGDFNFRDRWLDGVQKVEEVGHFLPRIGMRCRSIMVGGTVITYSSSYSYSDDRIEFCENEEGSGVATYFTLEKLERMRTRLTIDYYIEKNPIKHLVFNLLRKRNIQDKYQKSLINLEPLVREIQLPVE